jgi:hypothetical protein
MPPPIPFCSLLVLLLATLSLATVQFPSQVAGGKLCGGPAASLQYKVLLVQWVNSCFLPGGQRFMSGDALTLTMEPDPVRNVLLWFQRLTFTKISFVESM